MAIDRSESTEDTSQKPEMKKAEHEVDGKEAEKRVARREITLAIIQHGNRSVVILTIFLVVFVGVFFARKPLYSWLLTSGSIKIGSFEWKVREEVASAGLKPELGKLTDLSDEQIQLFLVVARARKTNAAGANSISYSGEEVSGDNLNKLQSIGLLTNVRPEGQGWSWTVTETGQRLHEILFKQITRSLRSAPVD